MITLEQNKFKFEYTSNFLSLFRPTLGPIQSLVLWIPQRPHPGVNDYLVLTTKYMELYLHSPMRLLVVVLKYTLLYTFHFCCVRN